MDFDPLENRYPASSRDNCYFGLSGELMCFLLVFELLNLLENIYWIGARLLSGGVLDMKTGCSKAGPFLCKIWNEDATLANNSVTDL